MILYFGVVAWWYVEVDRTLVFRKGGESPDFYVFGWFN